MSDQKYAVFRNTDQFLEVEYDYLVIGGGTAGLTVATRLSEDENVRVGVLEAGSAHLNDPALLTPAGCATVTESPDYDWGLKTVPQPGTHGIRHSYPRGKALGGSSAINYMQYVRGQESEYRDWNELTGYKTWGWEDLRPYFLKHEGFCGPSSSRKSPTQHNDTQVYYHSVPENHGTGGPIRTSFPTWGAPVEQDWLRAARSLGCDVDVPDDAWNGINLGVYPSLATIDRSNGPGTRSYATTGYLLPNGNRSNLSVLVNAQASRVILEKGRKDSMVRAVGAAFVVEGREHTVKATREVILSSGAVHTPQLLELSGIGQRDRLDSLGVDCVVDNKYVGEGLEDHVSTGVVYEVKPDVFTGGWMGKAEVAQKAMEDYQSGEGGILANPSVNNAFMPLAKVATDTEMAGVSAAMAEGPNPTSQVAIAKRQLLGKRISNPSASSFQMYMVPSGLNPSKQHAQKELLMTGVNAISVIVVLSHPFSQGSIHISSSSISDAPQIDPQYLQHPVDASIISAGLRYADSIFNTSPLKEQLEKRIFPDPGVDTNDTEAVKRYIHRHAMTSYHPIGTASLGQVVDERLRVFGVEGLRIVDASIFPMHISGNIIGSVYAIAEKAADLIKEDAQK